MYPLRKWKEYPRGYRFGVKTFYSPRHLGLDVICPTGVQLLAPFNGSVQYMGLLKEAGHLILFTCVVNGQKYVMRFMHNSKIVKTGSVKAGDVIALTGNTGLSKAPHVHVDISKNNVQLNNFGNFVDPEKFNWEADVSLKDNLTKGTLKKLKEAFFVKGNNTLDGNDIADYLQQDWKGKKLGESTFDRLVDYLYEHDARKKALLERRLMIQENEKLKKQLEKCKASGDKAYEALTTLEKIKALLKVK